MALVKDLVNSFFSDVERYVRVGVKRRREDYGYILLRR